MNRRGFLSALLADGAANVAKGNLELESDSEKLYRIATP